MLHWSGSNFSSYSGRFGSDTALLKNGEPGNFFATNENELETGKKRFKQ